MTLIRNINYQIVARKFLIKDIKAPYYCLLVVKFKPNFFRSLNNNKCYLEAFIKTNKIL